MNRSRSRQRRNYIFWAAALPFPLMLLAGVPWALAGSPRDIVFECPCSAEWVAGNDGQGTLELEFGLRSFRPKESGARLDFFVYPNRGDRSYFGTYSVGAISAGRHLTGLRATGSLRGSQPPEDAIVGIAVAERNKDGSYGPRLEELVLWPVPGEGGSERLRYVDILTDADGDGVGDVNERIAGTNPDDPASKPGQSTVDMLWLYDNGAPHGTQYAQMHHFKAVANAVFADSATNIRLRTVGIRRIEKTDSDGWPDRENLIRMMDLHGADITHQVGYALRPCTSACAAVGDVFQRRGRWEYGQSFGVSSSGALTVVHELGHMMGLAHSATQGEAHGSFRWSRGHYLNRDESRYSRFSDEPRTMGTIMSYGAWAWAPVFSDPTVDCRGEPCGVPVTEPGGANARQSLDLVRFQIAGHRDARPDSDGDGFVDDADAWPADPSEWIDSDADGLGDNADPDDDGDGVVDAQDRWPLDAGEWEDLDGDGIGDNADDVVEIEGTLDPFRDAALRRAVEQALRKSPGENISVEEMAGLRHLSAYNRGIRDLTGLELATGLTQLFLVANSLTDLSPLEQLTQLESLAVSWNPIVHLSPIAGLTELKSLYLDRALVSDLSPLAGLTKLESLSLSDNAMDDLSILAGLTELQSLDISGNSIVDLSPLSGLAGLDTLQLSRNRVSDVSFLSGLTNLRTLALEDNDISNLDTLSGLQALRELLLTGNGIADLTPLQGLAWLEILGLGENQVTDLSPLSGLTRLRDLRLDVNRITDLTPLGGLSNLRQLWLSSNEIHDLMPLIGLALIDLDVGRTDVSMEDVAALPAFESLRSLGLDALGISDVRPLTVLSKLERLSLNGNSITDVSPLAAREIWSDDRSQLHLHGNPLDDASIADHIPLIESWGVSVNHKDSPAVYFPDWRLHALVARYTAANWNLADVRVLTRRRVEQFYLLSAYNAGISDLTGLEAAINLRLAYLGSNSVSDVTPLADLPQLEVLLLNDNLVSDISPLLGLGTLRRVELGGNPLTEEALNEHIPKLSDAGVELVVESVEWVIPAGTGTASFNTKGYLESLLGPDLSIDAVGDDPGLAGVDMAEGFLRVLPSGTEGVMTATVTATNNAGKRASLGFRIVIADLEDDHGDEPASGTDLPLGVAVQGRIEAGDDADYFRLELSMPVSVAVYTTGDLDTVGSVRDGSDRLIASNDDGGAWGNFHIDVDLPPGVYYLRVESYGRGAGRYSLHARRFADVALGGTGETVRLWANAEGTTADGWTLNGVPFASGGQVMASNGDAYVLRFGPAGAWMASPAGSGEVDRQPSFRNATAPANQTYTVGKSIDTLTLPQATGGDGTLTYGLLPDVPGLTFNPGTRQLTGTPSTVGTYAMTYWVRDEDDDTESLGFSITVIADSPTEGSLGVCGVGMKLSPGQSCTYPGTADAFSVNARGRGSFLGRLAGIRIRINDETINGRVYDFEASHRGDGLWRIDRVGGRTEAGSEDPNADASPSFAANGVTSLDDLFFEVDKAIDPITLPEAKGGTGALVYTVRYGNTADPRGDPKDFGLHFDSGTRLLTGRPTGSSTLHSQGVPDTYMLTYSVRDADGNSDSVHFQVFIIAPGDTVARFRTGSFTDSTGRTIQFKLQFGHDWDLNQPRGLLIDFHGNNEGTEEDMLEWFGQDEDAFDRGLLFAAVASPSSFGRSEHGGFERPLFGHRLNAGGTRNWLGAVDYRLIHELLQSDFGGNAAVDHDRIVFRGGSAGTCFLNDFLARYAHIYGGGFHAWCGCIWTRHQTSRPPRVESPWTPTVPWSAHVSSQAAQRWRVFVEATTEDFLHEDGVAARDYYRDVLGLETRWDLDSPGGHCAAGTTPRDSILEWLTGLTPVPRILGSIAGDYDGDGLVDAVDTDDDNDGAPDIVDALPLEPREWIDTDADGTGDFIDADADGDGIDNASDAFPLNPLEWVDNDADGIGDNVDTDDDNDGETDEYDDDPLRVSTAGARNDQLAFKPAGALGVAIRSGQGARFARVYRSRPFGMSYPESSGTHQSFHSISLGDGTDPVFHIMVDSYERIESCEDVFLTELCDPGLTSLYYFERWFHKIYIDRNQNGDLTDDGTALVMARNGDAIDTDWTLAPGVRTVLSVPYSTGERLPYGMILTVNGAPHDVRVRFAGASTWMGMTSVPGGAPVLVGTVDANLDGVFNTGTMRWPSYDYDNVRDFACVDTDRDGWLSECDPHADPDSAFPFSPIYEHEQFMLDGRDCTLKLEPTGHRVRIDC